MWREINDWQTAHKFNNGNDAKIKDNRGCALKCQKFHMINSLTPRKTLCHTEELQIYLVEWFGP